MELEVTLESAAPHASARGQQSPGLEPEAGEATQTATRYRLWARVEYDGTDFFGFQIQARERTVQGEIERALEQVAGAKSRVVGAGRTDRGVHALGQVVSFEAEWKHNLADLQRALNAVLAADVAIVEMGLAAEGFHPRFAALGRTYRYTILNRLWRSAVERRTAWHVSGKLDLDRMARASGCLVGTHDFATFGRPPQGENTVRTVSRAEWQEQGVRLTFDIEANAFLYRMVRSIVGTLLKVGWGRMSPPEFEAVLRARDRHLVRQVAPACGLCLIRVDYPEGVLQ
jgi:tRNA pseudouridine38-40 synthase